MSLINNWQLIIFFSCELDSVANFLGSIEEKVIINIIGIICMVGHSKMNSMG